MNIQALEAAKWKINIGVLIFKSKAVLSLLIAALGMLGAVKKFFEDMKAAKANDGAIDFQEFTEAIGPVIVQYGEVEDMYYRLIGGNAFKIDKADFAAVNYNTSSLPNQPPKVIQPKQERTDIAPSEATEETTQQAAEESAEVADEVPGAKKQRPQPKVTSENGEVQ